MLKRRGHGYCAIGGCRPLQKRRCDRSHGEICVHMRVYTSQLTTTTTIIIIPDYIHKEHISSKITKHLDISMDIYQAPQANATPPARRQEKVPSIVSPSNTVAITWYSNAIQRAIRYQCTVLYDQAPKLSKREGVAAKSQLDAASA